MTNSPRIMILLALVAVPAIALGQGTSTAPPPEVATASTDDEETLDHATKAAVAMQEVRKQIIDVTTAVHVAKETVQGLDRRQGEDPALSPETTARAGAIATEALKRQLDELHATGTRLKQTAESDVIPELERTAKGFEADMQRPGNSKRLTEFYRKQMLQTLADKDALAKELRTLEGLLERVDAARRMLVDEVEIFTAYGRFRVTAQDLIQELRTLNGELDGLVQDLEAFVSKSAT